MIILLCVFWEMEISLVNTQCIRIWCFPLVKFAMLAVLLRKVTRYLVTRRLADIAV
jgi:hypothetical protein